MTRHFLAGLIPARRLLGALVLCALVLCALTLPATFHHAAAQPAQRPSGPPPEAADLEGGENLPPPRSDEEVPALTPEAASGMIKPLPPELPDRTKELLGDTTIILDIPLRQIPNYRDEMRKLVEDLGIYARQRDPKFTLITFGGFDLLTWSQREFELAEIKRPDVEKSMGDSMTPVGYPMRRFMQQVSGVMLDGFFCAPLRVPQADVTAMRAENVKILAIDHCPEELVPGAFVAAARSGVVAHVDADFDMPMDKRFATIPEMRPIPENSGSVENMSQAKNMLINLNSRRFGSREAWLAALGKVNHDVLVLDPFFNGNQALTKEEVRRLKFKALGSRRLVLAWLDVGHASDDSYYWQRDWKVGNPSWVNAFDRSVEGAFHVEFWNPAWKAIIGKGFAGFMDLGFDGIVLSGVEGYRRWETMTPIN